MEYFYLFLLIPLLFASYFIGYCSSQLLKIASEKQCAAKVNASEKVDETPAHIALSISKPLTLALAPIDALMAQPESSLSPAETKMLIAIRHNLGRLEEIVHQINLLENSQQINGSTLHLPSYAAEIMNCFEPMAKAREIRFHKILDLVADTELLLMDTLRFDKIVLNLLLQSFFHTPARGSISILLRTRQLTKGKVQLHCQVTDTGEPIAEADLPNPGRWHYRGGRSKPVNRDGTSMLLSADIAHAMGGSLLASTPDSGGSTLTLALLCLKADRYAMPTPAPYLDAIDEQIPEKPAGTLHIVEDDQEMADMLHSNLKDYFNIHIHGTAEEFLHFATKHAGTGKIDFDCVLINTMLPGMDGLELLHIIRQHMLLKAIPALILGGDGFATNRLKAFKLGADAYIVKPFHLSELRAQILNAMQRATLRAGNSGTIPVQHIETGIPLGKLLIDTVPNKRKEWMQQIVAVIEANLDDEQLSVPYLARQMAVSERQLFRLIKVSTGLSPNQVILEIRLNKALHLLQTGFDLSISDIAQQVGMNNASHFTSAFKKRFGKIPSELKK